MPLPTACWIRCPSRVSPISSRSSGSICAPRTPRSGVRSWRASSSPTILPRRCERRPTSFWRGTDFRAQSRRTKNTEQRTGPEDGVCSVLCALCSTRAHGNTTRNPSPRPLGQECRQNHQSNGDGVGVQDATRAAQHTGDAAVLRAYAGRDERADLACRAVAGTSAAGAAGVGATRRSGDDHTRQGPVRRAGDQRAAQRHPLPARPASGRARDRGAGRRQEGP